MSDLIRKLSAQVEETERERKRARDVQRKSAAQVGEYLRQKGSMGREELMDMVCSQLRLERYDAGTFPVDASLAGLLDRNLAYKHRAAPLKASSTVLWLAVENPLELPAFMEIEKATGYDVEPVCCTPADLDGLLAVIYAPRPSAQPVPQRPHDLQLGSSRHEPQPSQSSGSPMELIERILTKALTERSSQIHLRQRHMGLDIRFRIDGILYRIRPPKLDHIMPALTRLKDMANLDISKKTVAQQGTFSITVRGQEVRVRVSTVPTIDGENMVLHLPGHYMDDIGLAALGMSPAMRGTVLSAADKNSGMILACGPSNSGRTTLLYSLLQEIARPELSIFTLQESTFYNLDFACQVRTSPQAGYADCLTNILRQEPDVILVDQCKDIRTAALAFDAALGGCLVLTALHAHTAAGAVARLTSMGVSPYDISACLQLSVGTRLVRRICPDCHGASGTSAAVEGCPNCKGTGHKGRMGIFETFVPDDMLRSIILRERPFTELQRAGEEGGGIISLRQDARQKVSDGLTSQQEVERIL